MSDKKDDGVGCFTVVIIVLVILWLTGNLSKQVVTVTTPATTTEPTTAKEEAKP